MAQYFIRYTGNVQADMERGYSFVGYSLVATKEAALTQLAEYTGEAFEDDFDAEAWNDENEHRVGQDNSTGLWGTVRSGLCGYGAFESIEDAIEAMNDPMCQYHATKFCAIFEGRQTYNQELDGLDDGQTFRPISIIRTFSFDFETSDYLEVV